MVGGLRPGDAGVLPLGRQRISCWFAGVPGVDYIGFVWLWASRGPRSVATILRCISRLDLIKPSTTNMELCRWGRGRGHCTMCGSGPEAGWN